MPVLIRFTLILYMVCAALAATCQHALSAEELRDVNYSRADSVAVNFNAERGSSCASLTHQLIRSFSTDHEKFRVIFRWICENISYKDHYYVNDPEKVLAKRKAVCSGFSTLLDRMCEEAGINYEVISGFARTTCSDIGVSPKKSNHSWNAVNLYGKWYLCDVTWATSSYSLKDRKHHKEFDDSYFLPPPSEFVLQHFPLDVSWQLLNKSMSRAEFAELPVIFCRAPCDL